LKNKGVEEIETEGREFDFSEMEALGGEGSMVEKTVKRGYKLNGRVLVPAKVMVKNCDGEGCKDNHCGSHCDDHCGCEH
jgi:molecular chaperone GrpE (heat shock protein)